MDKQPSLYNNIYDNMYNYNDEDMFQRWQFITNIPYFRGLDNKTVTRIGFLMK